MFLYFVLILILDIEVPRENVEVRLTTSSSLATAAATSFGNTLLRCSNARVYTALAPNGSPSAMRHVARPLRNLAREMRENAVRVDSSTRIASARYSFAVDGSSAVQYNAPTLAYRAATSGCASPCCATSQLTAAMYLPSADSSSPLAARSSPCSGEGRRQRTSQTVDYNEDAATE
eukprot:31187-Pelagococcus_subviridis.AAC.3